MEAKLSHHQPLSPASAASWLLLFVVAMGSAGPCDATPYKRCIALYTKQRFLPALRCICHHRATHKPRKNIQLYHLAVLHRRVATKAPALSSRRRIHLRQAWLRYRDYLRVERKATERINLVNKAIARLQRDMALATLKLVVQPSDASMQIDAPLLRCRKQGTRWRCHIKGHTTALQRCVYQPFSLSTQPNGRLRFPPGLYKLRAQKPSHLPVSRPLLLSPQEAKTLQIRLQPATAALTVRTLPHGASLRLRSKHHQEPPRTSPHHYSKLPPGRYQLLIQKAGYLRLRQHLHLKAQQRNRLLLSLRRPSTLPRQLLITSGVIGGVAVLALAGGLGASVFAHQANLQANLAGYQSQNWRTHLIRAEQAATAGYILYASAGAVGATAAALLLLGLHERNRHNIQPPAPTKPLQ